MIQINYMNLQYKGSTYELEALTVQPFFNTQFFKQRTPF